jgi:hypothetical protein
MNVRKIITATNLAAGFVISIAAVVVLAAVVWTALYLIQVEIQVDYDSGAERQIIFAGPFQVRTDPCGYDYLGRLSIRNGRTGLTGVPQWQVALRFHGNSRVSPNCRAGRILGSIRQLETWFLRRHPNNMGEIKERFLKTLASGGESQAQQVVMDFEKAMLAEEGQRP